MAMWLDWLAVGVGGFFGALGRYGLGFVPGYHAFDFPGGTMVINLMGAFLIGLLSGLAPTGMLPERSRLLLQTGFCGGFTTFSTFSLETLQLLDQGRFLAAGGYALGSVLICLLGVWAGRMLALRYFA